MAADLHRHEYLCIERVFCEECGDVFLLREPSGYACICAGCVRLICSPPSNECFTIFRALRPDEDPLGQGGFRSKNPRGNFTVEDHVEFGSHEQVETQYVSATSSLEVSIYFALMGFFISGKNPRVAEMAVPYDYEKYSAIDQIPYTGSATARNYARCFKELVYTEESINVETTIKRVLSLDTAKLGGFKELFENRRIPFADFKRQYKNSDLAAALIHALSTDTLIATMDLVELPHYANQRPRNIAKLRLSLENDNIFDSEAVCLFARGAHCRDQWFRVGHLSREHAYVIRSMLEASGGRCTIVEPPNFEANYETEIKVKFTVPARRSNALCDAIHDTCGKVEVIKTAFV